MRECVEEGVLQAFADNELSSEIAEKVAVHLAACSICADAMRVVVDETALLSTAFEAEMAREVPTVRLRERIDAAIAVSSGPSLAREQRLSPITWIASLGGLLKVTPQRAIGFASLIAVVAFAAIFAVIQLRRTEPDSALVTGTDKSQRSSGNASQSPVREINNSNRPPANHPNSPPGDRPLPKKKLNPNDVPQPDQLPRDELARALPGEENYLKAIDSLALEIQTSGETAMKPSLRAEYERNLAVVNQAIDSTRRVARRHRDDPDAAEFLYSSYQSKLDLLSTVADQVRPTIATR